jgi:transcriptional regulator with XRE-family HTH domain
LRWNIVESALKIKVLEDINFKKVVGHNIRKVRELKGFSGDRLAEAIDFSTKQLYKVERGEVACSYEIIILIARALNVPIKCIFDGVSLNNQKEEVHNVKIKISEYLEVKNFIMRIADEL